jgi:Arc/MetJ-type ribon-helix-helix transcriptional regulator
MTKNVIQIRMPEKLAEDIEGLVKKGLDELWDKVRQGEAWKERFGESADEVMATLRKRR